MPDQRKLDELIAAAGVLGADSPAIKAMRTGRSKEMDYAQLVALARMLAEQRAQSGK